MKLTKGKISKAINKNKQSLKKYKKNGRKSNKSRTFRRRKSTNLDKTTLKNYNSLIGGGPLDDNTKSSVDPGLNPNPIPPDLSDPMSKTSISEGVDPVITRPIAEEPIAEKIPVVIPTETPEIPAETSEIPAATSEIPAATSEIPAVTSEIPAVTSEIPEVKEEEIPAVKEEEIPAVKEVEENLAATPEKKDETIISATPLDNTSKYTPPPPPPPSAPLLTVQAAEGIPAPELPELQSIPLTQPTTESNTNNITLPVESVENLINYITSKIADKLKNQLNGSSNNLNDDSFKAVETSTRTM